jgi:hypothetical protein
MEQEFYASIKLVSGEEIFTFLSVLDEDERTLLLLDSPLIISHITTRSGAIAGYKVQPWMSIPDDSMYIIDMNKVITMTEVTNQEIIKIYHKFNKSSSKVNIDRTMGLISKVDEARRSLEKSYRDS